MNLKLEIEFSKTEILEEIDALKKQIDDMRPLPEDVEGKVMQKLRLDWNYNSNAIEGNKLSYGETAAFLSEGITAKGKPLKDHLDIRGHNEAISFLIDIVKDSRPISESDIRTLHKIILVEPYEVKAQTDTGVPTKKRINLGEYKTSPNHVKTSTGEIHYYATPEETPAKMQELMGWYIEVSNSKSIHPIVIAAMFHHKFVAIHPFDDGNGRLSRILMNLIIMQNGYPPVVVKMDDRQNYYALLRRADVGENWPFVEYIAERLLNSLQLYVKAAKGGDIEEDEDIDKDIALFKLDIASSINVKQKRSTTAINNILTLDIGQLINQLNDKVEKFSELFFDFRHSIGLVNKHMISSTYDSLEHFVNSETGIAQEKKIEDLSFIIITFELIKFKNADNDFSLANYITVHFKEYFYEILDLNRNIIVKKLYHERLSKIDFDKTIKSAINDLKIEIIKNRKSPE